MIQQNRNSSDLLNSIMLVTNFEDVHETKCKNIMHWLNHVQIWQGDPNNQMRGPSYLALQLSL
jgi:hypothetical protein